MPDLAFCCCDTILSSSNFMLRNYAIELQIKHTENSPNVLNLFTFCVGSIHSYSGKHMT